MSLSAVFLWCSLVYQVHATFDVDDAQTCPPDLQYADTNRAMNISESCNERACIAECCLGNQSIFWNQQSGDRTCDDSTNLTQTYNIIGLDEYPELDIYKNSIEREIINTTRTIKQFILIFSYNFLYTEECTTRELKFTYPFPAYLHYVLEASDVNNVLETVLKTPMKIMENGGPSEETYERWKILFNGSLVIRRTNYFHQWVREYPPGQFCVEQQVVLSKDGNVYTELVFMLLAEKNSGDDFDQKNTLSAYGLLVSCVFLALVLAVYALLPELRNLAGLILMPYVATLIAAFVSRAVLVLTHDYNLLGPTGCLYIGFIQYYTILASFTWMNVMSFDIWWSMRGFHKLHQTNRRGVLVKLCWYGLYGWGAPLLPVFFMVIVENIDMTHLPDFVTPHYLDRVYCFMREDERLLYMNGPILITTCINLTLFLMTAYNIWRIKRGVAQHSAGDSRRNKSDETRFGIYLKLFLIMGVNWVLEVVGSVYKTDSLWWSAPDVLNSLIGLFIFIIFVCKKKIVVLLCKRFSIGNKLVLRLQSVDSTRTESVRLNERRSLTVLH